MDEQTRILSEIAENRAAFFELVEQLEEATGLSVDTIELEAEIDMNHPRQLFVNDEEAKAVLAAAAV